MISQYADDLVIYITNKQIKISERNLQDALNYLVTLLGEIGLTLSPTKSNYCVFIRGQRRILPVLKLYEEPLLLVECVKYLSVWLDRSLHWRKHINETVSKCTKFLNLLKVLAGSTWGVHTKHLRRLYISLVRSRIDYACYLYDCSAKTHICKLDKLQNQALRVVGGFIRSTPIHVMESE